MKLFNEKHILDRPYVSFSLFLVFGHFWQWSYENTKILRNLCLHFARQDRQDGKNRKENTKRWKYGMNETTITKIFSLTRTNWSLFQNCPKHFLFWYYAVTIIQWLCFSLPLFSLICMLLNVHAVHRS